MECKRRSTRAYYLLHFAFSAFIGGCGDGVQVSPAAHEDAKLSPKQELAEVVKKAASGDATAQYTLGRAYVKGEGVPKDAVKAVELLQHSAAQGNARAQDYLGRMYARGEGVPKDSAKAFELLQKSAVQGDAQAQANLGVLYMLGEGVPRDPVKAVAWFQKSAAQGNAHGQNMLALSYEDGIGVPKDLSRAVDWWQKSAAQGEADAQWIVGKAYANGIVVAKDDAKAVEWWQKAAAQGQVKAQLALGGSYYLGEGVAKDVVLGYAWSNLAAAGGQETGATVRDFIESGLSANERTEAQRLASNWKKGEILVREGTAVHPAPSATPDARSKRGSGTMFLVSKTGHAITNQHVAADCLELRIQGRDDVAKLLVADKFNDLALVQLQSAVTDTATIAVEPGRLRQGEEIVAFGFPLNSVLSSGGNLSPGVVSALTGLGNNTNQIQITAPMQPGSSGSPVLNKKGEVVGVVSMKLDDMKMAKATGQVGQNVNFAVSGQTLKSFLDAHNVSYNTGRSFVSREKSTADLADEARKWTLAVECWR